MIFMMLDRTVAGSYSLSDHDSLYHSFQYLQLGGDLVESAIKRHFGVSGVLFLVWWCLGST